MPKLNLTQAFIDQATCPSGKSKIDYFDTKVTNLLLKVLPSGKKTFYVRYKNERDKIVEKRLSTVDATGVKLADARELAQQYLAQIALGVDPFEQKKSLRDVPTFGEFVAQSYMPHIKGYKRSWNTDESLLRNHILPVIGKLYMDEINRRHMVGLFASHRETHKPASTNRIIILCRYIFNCAIRWEVPLVKNPTEGIALYLENNRHERYISSAEAQRLFEALNQSDSKMLKYIVSMLLLTGARKNEVLQAKWPDFDIERRIWRIEFNKTGRTRHVPISDGVLSLLHSVPRFEGVEYVFPNPDTQQPYVQIFSSWDTARKKAGLSDVRIHDLRHSFASFLVNSGRSLYEVQKILGHTQVKTTQRYAHLSQDSLVSAANEVSKAIPLSAMLPSSVTQVPLVGAS